jgi:DNA-binding IclR family transcriptional regulator
MAPEKKTDYTIEAQQNLMRIVQYLATDVTRVVVQKEIEEALELSYSKVNFALHNLRMQGWSEQVADGWRLCPLIVKIAVAAHKGIADTMARYGGTA